MDCLLLLEFGRLLYYRATGLMIKAENDWWDKQPQVVMHC